MTISKCILFATLVLGVNVANATADASDCSKVKNTSLTGISPVAKVQMAKNLTGQNDSSANEEKRTQTADAAAAR